MSWSRLMTFGSSSLESRWNVWASRAGETVLVSSALYAGSTHRLTIGSVMLVAATVAVS